MSASERAPLANAHLVAQAKHHFAVSSTSHQDVRYPTTHERRRRESITEPVKIDESKSKTVLYLAYGSNLCDETFLGKRGIRPLSATNVVVPDLRLTFDLPGMPYSEPCFANSALRPHKESKSSADSHLLPRDYHKNHWKKGLVGVVYEVNKNDYNIIIATEGGGAAYEDILIDCFPLSDDQNELVPEVPSSQAFKAHTLFAPADPPAQEYNSDDPPLRRPDPSYAQASARYLKLITDGAAERKLPFEYQRYLAGIRPYTITQPRQRIGSFVLTLLWTPFIMLLFGLAKMLAGKNGKAPAWVAWLLGAMFRAIWVSYDLMFKPIFGDGERTVGKDDYLELKAELKENHTIDSKPIV